MEWNQLIIWLQKENIQISQEASTKNETSKDGANVVTYNQS